MNNGTALNNMVQLGMNSRQNGILAESHDSRLQLNVLQGTQMIGDGFGTAGTTSAALLANNVIRGDDLMNVTMLMDGGGANSTLTDNFVLGEHDNAIR